MTDATKWRERVATILEIIARDRLPNPHDLDVALDAIECETADEIERLRAERDHMREALSRLIGAVDLANASLARGEGEQWIHSQLAPAAGAARASLDPAPLFGRWPGDESDEEIERLLKDF